MPKVKPSKAGHLRQIVSEFGEEIFSTDGKILFCKICKISVAADKRFTVQQHISRDKHVRGIQNAKKTTSQLLIGQSVGLSANKSGSSEFFKDLCEVLASANIPLWKLTNNKFRDFLERHTGHTIPDESTLRKNYIPVCYNNTLTRIRNKVHGKKIFVSIDESTDVEARYVANVMVGTLEVDGPGEIFLLTTEVLESVNHSTICRLFDRSMFLLWPEGIQHDDVLLFVTDAAPYIVKAAKSIMSFYPKMIHVTCLAHALHTVAEEVRGNFPDVDSLVSNTKKIFVKAPSRRELFKSLAPNVPLPPEPIITCWGTWVDACIYYCDNFQIVKTVVESLKSEDTKSIQNAQQLYANSEMKGKLAYIKTHFGCLSPAIAQLQEKGMALMDSVALVKKTELHMNSVSGEVGKIVANKVNRVLEKNEGFKTLCKISQVLSGEIFDTSDIKEELTPSDLVYFKYAPIVSVDVERSFSMYRSILADNRRSFTFDHLRMFTVIYCNAE